MTKETKEKIINAAKEFAITTIIDSEEHMDAVADFEERFTQGAEWFLENYKQLKEKSQIEFVDAINAAIDNYAMILLNQCDIADFNEEEKLNLLDSFKFPYEEGIDWAYENYEE